MRPRATPTRWAWAGLAGLLTAAMLVGCGGPKETTTAGFLALGDSAPFGFRLAAEAGYDDESDFVGYPRLLAGDRDLRLYDGSCPGETTASFLDVDAISNGCTNDRGSGEGYRDSYPLHADYDGSQLDYALAMLESHPDIGLVTVQLGANDALLCLQTLVCLLPAGVTAMADQVRENVAAALDALRNEGGYQGRIVVLNYSAKNYRDPIEVAGLRALNAALATAAEAHDATVVDTYSAFETAAQSSGGNSVDAGLVLSGDTHPSRKGQQLIARLVDRLL